MRFALLICGALVVATGQTTGAAAADDDQARADRYFQRGVHFAKRGDAAQAIENYEQALPYRNQTGDIFFNLVQVCDAGRKWSKVLLYGQGFLHLEPRSADAKDIKEQMAKARNLLIRRGLTPQEVTFEVPVTGAQIFVNHVGVPTTRSTSLAPGQYEVRVEAADFKPYRDKFTVGSNEPTKVTAALQGIIYHGQLAIITEPAEGVTVFIDDKEIGVTPLEPMTLVADRRYLVRFEKDDWDSWLRYVTIPRDETYELTPKMEQTEARFNRFTERPD